MLIKDDLLRVSEQLLLQEEGQFKYTFKLTLPSGETPTIKEQVNGLLILTNCALRFKEHNSEEYQLVYNRLKLDKDSIQIVPNTKDTQNVSWAIRIQTNEECASEKEKKKKRTNLDFIFTGPKSKVICEQIQNIFNNVNLTRDQVLKQYVDQECLLKMQVLSDNQHLHDVFVKQVRDQGALFSEDDFWEIHQDQLSSYTNQSVF